MYRVPGFLHSDLKLNTISLRTVYFSRKPSQRTTSDPLDRLQTYTHADLTILPEKGQPYDFSQLKGKVVLIVNTASKCGFTPQLAGLETLYKSIKSDPDPAISQGFELLGFPCNQFGGQ